MAVNTGLARLRRLRHGRADGRQIHAFSVLELFMFVNTITVSMFTFFCSVRVRLLSAGNAYAVTK